MCKTGNKFLLLCYARLLFDLLLSENHCLMKGTFWMWQYFSRIQSTQSFFPLAKVKLYHDNDHEASVHIWVCTVLWDSPYISIVQGSMHIRQLNNISKVVFLSRCLLHMQLGDKCIYFLQGRGTIPRFLGRSLLKGFRSDWPTGPFMLSISEKWSLNPLCLFSPW